MPDIASSLWSPEIRADVQSPSAILQVQAGALARQTNGVLQGEVQFRQTRSDKKVMHFDILVPALDNYRHRILSVAHNSDLIYPVLVDAEILRPFSSLAFQDFLDSPDPLRPLVHKPMSGQADNDRELLDLLATILRSPQVVSLAQSLVARATDTIGLRERQAQPPSKRGDDSAASDPATDPEEVQ